jgi:CRP/FNR family transcriptional regulator
MSVLESLKRSELFSLLKDEELKAISNLFKEVSFSHNETIFNEGDPSERFYIVAAGSVKIIKHTVMGKDIILEVMSPGDIFGGVAVLDRKPYPASAQAMENTSVVFIERNDLLNLMEEYPSLKLEVVKYFSNKLRDAHEMLKNIATERVERRIAGLLLKLSEKVGSDDGEYRKIDFPLTRQEIAEMVGTTVETCIRTISRFQKKGLVKSANGRVSIKVAALKQLVEE